MRNHGHGKRVGQPIVSSAETGPYRSRRGVITTLEVSRLLRTLFCFTSMFLVASQAFSNPNGPQIARGIVDFSNPDASTLNIANSPGSIINWQGFSIKANELTRFLQQGADSAVLNRVVGADPSNIMGQLVSNGQVFLINRNGIVFGPNATVNVAGLVASTLDISDRNFVSRNLRFEAGEKPGSIVNNGSIHGKNSVILIAPDVENSGLLRSSEGDVVLAAGERVFMTDLSADGIVFEVQASDNKAVNLGSMVVEHGAVGVFASQLVHSGNIEANRAIQGADGSVQLVAAGSAQVTGSIKTLGQAGQSGGTVHVLAKDIRMNGASIDASGEGGGGNIRIGGAFQGGGSLPTADNTYLDKATVIHADATRSGNGGEIIVWSDGHTDSQALLTARGGPRGGRGGLVETSGKRTLEFGQPADVSAPRGDPGTWLLDPEDIVIDSGKANSIESALNKGSNVSVKTSDSGDGEGNITVASAIIKTAGDDAKLSLTAHNEIQVNAPIRSEHNALHVGLKAGARVAVNASIDTNGGNLTTAITGIDPRDPARTQEIGEVNETNELAEETLPEVAEQHTTTAAVNSETDAEDSKRSTPAEIPNASAASPGSTETAATQKTSGDQKKAPNQETHEPEIASITVVSDEITTSAPLTDGTIAQITELSQNSNVEIAVNAVISTSGGEIKIDAGTSGLATLTGKLNTSSLDSGTRGGDITVVGDTVWLQQGALVDASGDIGGGDILLGIDGTTGIHTMSKATQTYVAQGASIRSDAITDGDAGKAIIWSDESTGFLGNISAKGGRNSGNGGLVETSSNSYLEATGLVNASARSGDAGLWLLQSKSIEVASVNIDQKSTDPFLVSAEELATRGDKSLVDNSSITTSLSSGTNVKVSAGFEGERSGEIIVSDSVYNFSGDDVELTLDAVDDVVINADIRDKSGNQSLDLNLIGANSNDTDDHAGVVIDTAGGRNSVYISGIDELNVNGAGLAIRAEGRKEAQVRASELSVDVSGGVKIESSDSDVSGNAILVGVGGDTLIRAGHLSVIAHNGDAKLLNLRDNINITTSSNIGSGEYQSVGVLVKTDGRGDALIDGNEKSINVQNGGIFSLISQSKNGGSALLSGGPTAVTAGAINLLGGPGKNASSEIRAASGDISLLAPGGKINVEAGSAPGADVVVSAQYGDVTISGGSVNLGGTPDGGRFIIEAQTLGGEPGTVYIIAGDAKNPGSLTISRQGRISDPASLVIQSGSCSVDGGSCVGDPLFDAPGVNFIDLGNPGASILVNLEEDAPDPLRQSGTETSEGGSARSEIVEEVERIVEEFRLDATNKVISHVKSTESILTKEEDENEDKQNTDKGKRAKKQQKEKPSLMCS